MRGIRVLARALGEEEEERFAESLLGVLGARPPASPSFSFPEFERWYLDEYAPQAASPGSSGIASPRLQQPHGSVEEVPSPLRRITPPSQPQQPQRRR